MKRYIILSALALCLLSLAACGGGQTAQTSQPTPVTPSATQPTQTESVQTEPVAETPRQEPETEQLPAEELDEPAKIEIDWKTVTIEEQDQEGYTFQVSFKISPWILLSNSDAIKSAWDEVSLGEDVPSFNSWGLEKQGQYYTRYDIGFGQGWFAFPMNDMYYCIGNVSVKNVTQGWSISADSPKSMSYNIRWQPNGEVPDVDPAVTGRYSIGRAYYSSYTDDYTDGVRFNPLMKSDKWGDAPFVIMVPENFTPNYPNGQFFDLTATGTIFLPGGTEVKIGIIGKDGEYTPPPE